MSLILVGTSHRLSPVEVRERVAFDVAGAAEGSGEVGAGVRAGRGRSIPLRRAEGRARSYPRLIGPLPYIGGKRRLAPTIVALMPPHQTYVEPFAGGAGGRDAPGRGRLVGFGGRVGGVQPFQREQPCVDRGEQAGVEGGEEPGPFG